MKRLLLIPIIAMLATPAQALTWGEFWEPFRYDMHYDYIPPHQYHSHRICETVVTRRVWVPGYWLGPYNYVEGYYENRGEILSRRC